MERVVDVAPTCRVIRSVEEYKGKQGPSYAGGISAESVGSQAIWLGMVTIPPGGSTKAHLHDGHETAFYVLSGECDLWYGENLQEHARGSRRRLPLHPGQDFPCGHEPQSD